MSGFSPWARYRFYWRLLSMKRCFIERARSAACFFGWHRRDRTFEIFYHQLRLKICECVHCGAYIEKGFKITTQVPYDNEVPFECFKIESFPSADPNSAFYSPPWGAQSDDGVSLTSMAHPVGSGANVKAELNPDNLETIEIDIPERPVLPAGTIQYEQLLPGIGIDLCATSLALAVEKLKPEVSCDLWISRSLAQDDIAERVLGCFPEDFIVNRIRIEPSLRDHEWFVECGDGRMVGSAGP
jgi:hypothetical protein